METLQTLPEESNSRIDELDEVEMFQRRRIILKLCRLWSRLEGYPLALSNASSVERGSAYSFPKLDMRFSLPLTDKGAEPGFDLPDSDS